MLSKLLCTPDTPEIKKKHGMGPKNSTEFATLLLGAWTFLPASIPKHFFDYMSQNIKNFLHLGFNAIV